MSGLIRGQRGIVGMALVNCTPGGSVKGYGFGNSANPAAVFVRPGVGVVGCWSPWLLDPNTLVFITPIVTPDGVGLAAFSRITLLTNLSPVDGLVNVELLNAAGAATDGTFSIMLVNLAQSSETAADYTVV